VMYVHVHDNRFALVRFCRLALHCKTVSFVLMIELQFASTFMQLS